MFALIVAGGFVLMEPLTAATHRWVMHGIERGSTAATIAPAVPRGGNATTGSR
jgi:hypothetical protein